MKQSIITFTEKNFERNSNITSITNHASETNPFEQSKMSEESVFEKECKEGMTIGKFRAAALKQVNNLPWKK